MQTFSILTGDGPLRVLALGAHADDIEIGCGGTLLRLAAERRELEVTWVVFCSTPERAAEARAAAGAFLAGVAALSASSCTNHRDGFLAVLGRRGEGGLRGAEARGRPRSRLHALPGRPPPGSPARLGAHLEHLAGPPDPRVRDPEVRRRLRLAERVRRAPGRVLERKIALVLEHFRSPGAEAVVHGRTSSGLSRVFAGWSAWPQSRSQKRSMPEAPVVTSRWSTTCPSLRFFARRRNDA